MSKLKILLLGGIFTLVGIFNFGFCEFSVPGVTFLGEFSPTNVSTYYSNFANLGLNKPGLYKIVVSGYKGFCPSGDSSTYGCLTMYQYRYGGTFKPATNFESGNNVFMLDLKDNELNGYINVYNRGGDYKLSIYRYDNLSLYDYGFSPAIDSLKITVYQIIPYVVYIGIGTFLAILGFYAVRRLVNRIVKKINSVFRSKRG